VTFKRVEDPKEAGLQLEMLKDYGYGERGSDVCVCGLLWGGGPAGVALCDVQS
jgi:hypothetical protein